MLERSIDGAIDQLFGGSVAKHTYVDGLSDVDSLIILNETSLEKKTPHDALLLMEHALQKRLDASVSSGRMAVTIEYKDGMQIQLLPVVEKRSGGMLIPSSRHPDNWSHVDPAPFQEALTARNQSVAQADSHNKIGKAINGTLPEPQRLSGYHIEYFAV